MSIRVSSTQSPSIRQLTWKALLLFENPIWSGIFALILYSIFASLKNQLWGVSSYPYFNYLADAFLHGQLHLRLSPSSTHDLVFYAGNYYLYWPPFPAVVMMPFVAIFGVGFSDIFFTVAVGALNVALFALLLRQAKFHLDINTSVVQRALLVLFFAFGTVHVTLVLHGRVWQTGQLLTFFFTLVVYLATISMKEWPAFFITGLATASAVLTRNHLLIIGIWPAYYLLTKHWKYGIKKLVGFVAVGLLPLLIFGVAYMSYNYLRFGDMMDVGLDYHQMAELFEGEYENYGPFNIYYLPRNFYYQYIHYPYPSLKNVLMGGSLFLLSPVFFAAFWGIVFGKPRTSIIFLVLTILFVNIPILLLMGTGWVQFGPRYTLDFTTPLLLLTAIGIRRWSLNVLVILTVISVIHYMGGVLILLNF